jgi:hypothetical protein
MRPSGSSATCLRQTSHVRTAAAFPGREKLARQSNPRPIRGACALTAALAAGYLWAVVAGDGIHGLKGVDAVSNADSFPDANVAFILCIVAYGLSPLWAAYWSDFALEHYALTKWFAATALAGAALFAVSRLLISRRIQPDAPRNLRFDQIALSVQ